MFVMVPANNVSKKGIYADVLKNTYIKDNIVTLENGSKDALYMVCRDKLRGFLGSAILQKFSTADVATVVKEHPHWNSAKKFFWRLSDSRFHLDDDDPAHHCPSTFEALCRNFYFDLYEALVNFGISHNQEQLVTYNLLDEHEDTKFFGEWPYAVECADVMRTEGDFAYGILPLNDKYYEKFKAARDKYFT